MQDIFKLDKNDIIFHAIENSVSIKLQKGDIEGAIAECENAMKRLKSINDKDSITNKKRLAMLFTNEGKCFYNKAKQASTQILCFEFIDKAEALVEKGYKIWSELNDQYNIAVTNTFKADISFYKDGNYNKWLETYESSYEALSEMETHNSIITAAEILCEIVTCFINQLNGGVGANLNIDYETSLNYISEAQRIYREESPQNELRIISLRKVKCILELSFAQTSNDYKSIAKEIESVLKSYLRLSEKEGTNETIELQIYSLYNSLGVCFDKIGEAYGNKLQYNKAICYLKKALYYYEKGDKIILKKNGEYSDEHIGTLLNESLIYILLYECDDTNAEDIKTAVNMLKVLKKIQGDKDKESSNYAQIIHRLGKCCYCMEKYSSAQKYYKEAEKILDNIKYNIEELYYYLYIDIVNLYYALGKGKGVKKYVLKLKNILLLMGYEESSDQVKDLMKLIS